jgi:hypothetical protein
MVYKNSTELTLLVQYSIPVVGNSMLLESQFSENYNPAGQSIGENKKRSFKIWILIRIYVRRNNNSTHMTARHEWYEETGI